MKRILQSSLVLAGILVATTSCAQTIINVEGVKKQKMTYGMDFERLWYWNGLDEKGKTELMDLALKQCRVDYARVAINGAAEINEGKINWKAYGRVLDCMAHIKKARPDIKFFASPRPFHEAVKGSPYTCFPHWVTPINNKRKTPRAEGFFPEKAADYYVRYMKFITSKGYKITYLDLKNECCRNLRPAPLSQMAGRIREGLKQENIDCPLLIAPSSFDYKAGCAWLNEAIENKDTDFFDIAASHNTKMKGSLEDFSAMAQKLGKPSWNTELHFFKGPDPDAVANTEIVLRHIRAGFSGLNDWLSLANEKKDSKMFRVVDGKLVVMRTYYIFRQLVNTSCGGYYLTSNKADGITNNIVMLKDDLMTVWVLNADKEKSVDLTVNLKQHEITSAQVQVSAWGPDSKREATVSAIKAASAREYHAKVQPDSLYCYQFKVKAN